jgi:hypothetical protein
MEWRGIDGGARSRNHRGMGGALMTVTLELKPELEQQVRTRAAANGVSFEAYLLSVIEDASAIPTFQEATLEEFEAAMDAFSEGTEALPVLPPEALTRESMYEGR